ncbi:MAG TPA: nitric oxide synthase oxygenase [Ktedonobacteraceae bacterium]|jgi:nitric-oxide synthase, bacterial
MNRSILKKYDINSGENQLLLYEGKHPLALPMSHTQRVLTEATSYLSLFYKEQGIADIPLAHLAQIRKEIEQTGTYQQSRDSMAYGARVAWRNASRCIGRIHWNTLAVRDMRHLTTAEEIFEALLEHIKLATNEGKITPLITIFAPQQPGQPGIRIWNPQLIRYAGYRQPDGSILGDPLHTNLTEIAKKLGWLGGAGTPFDLLPIIIQMPNQPPRLFEIPPELVLEVPLSHPNYPWFADLNLKWHALPVISNMRMEIGGISYTAAPFNGWYMGTEIGARNLGDNYRYNLLPIIAKGMGLDTRTERTLWKDRAIVELNVAVLSSFAKSGVRIVDHHTASRQFMAHHEHEQQAGRQVAADWGWIVPPISGSTTSVFHVPYRDSIQTPNFFYQ